MHLSSRTAPRNTPQSQGPNGNSDCRIALGRQRQVQAICRVPRLVLELLNKLDRYHGLGDDLDRRLEKYAAVDLNELRALGADRLPPLPIHSVGGRR
jgi:hypothetical protein